MGLKLGPNSHWPYHGVEILGKPELLKLFDSGHTLVSKTPIMMSFKAWLRTWVLWLSDLVSRSKNLRVRVVCESAWSESSEQQSHGKWQCKCIEQKRRLELRGVLVMVGGIRRLILVSHLDYLYLSGCDWKEGTRTRWAISQRKTMEAMAVNERKSEFFFLFFILFLFLICYYPLPTCQKKYIYIYIYCNTSTQFYS